MTGLKCSIRDGKIVCGMDSRFSDFMGVKRKLVAGMKKRGMSQRSISREVGVSLRYVNKWCQDIDKSGVDRG